MAVGGYADDPTIPDEAELWRRVPPGYIVYDPHAGRRRPSSMAFYDHQSGSPMSVVLAAEARGLEAVLAGHAGYALVAITVGLVRACGQGVARDPLPNEPAHAVVFGRKTAAVRKRLVRGSRWVVPPPDS